MNGEDYNPEPRFIRKCKHPEPRIIREDYEPEPRIIRERERPESIIITTSGEKPLFTGDNDTLEQAFTNFSQGNYQEAKQLFKNYNDASITQPEPEIIIFQNNAKAREKAQNDNQKSWKIAVIVTGFKQEKNQAHLRGIEEAQSNFNNKRKFQEKSLIEIVIVDNSEPNDQSLKSVSEKLTQYSDLIAVISTYTSKNTEKVLDLYQQKKILKIPLLTASATATMLKNDYFFRLPPTNKESANILSCYLMSKLGNKNIQKGIVIWSEDDLFSRSLKEDFEDSLGKDKEIWQDIIPVTEINNNIDDIENIFTEQYIKKNDTKYVLLAMSYRHKDIAKTISNLNNKLPKTLQLILLTGDALYEEEKKAKERINNLVLVVPWFSDNSWGIKMSDKWEGRVSWRTAMSYDALQVIFKSIERLEEKKIKPTQESIWKELRLPDFYIDKEDTSGENLSFDKEQNSTHKPRLIETCVINKKPDFCPIDRD